MKMVFRIVVFAVLAVPFAEAQAQQVVQFTVQQPPEFIVDGGADVLYTDGLTIGGAPTAIGGGGAYTYQWEPAVWVDDPTLANPTVLPLSGNMIFTLTVTDLLTGCTKTDVVVVLFDPSNGVGAENGAAGIRIFPNPASDLVHVQCATGIAALGVYSLDGALIHSDNGGAKDAYILDLSSLEPGLYFMTVTTADDRSLTTRLCKL